MKTGRTYTAVIVDSLRNQCLVRSRDRNGTTDAVLRSIATDGAGDSYARLRDPLIDYPEARRRADLDA